MLENILTIFTLVGLEGLLSADNALILAILVKHLDKPQQKKALLYGIAGAFLFRFLSLLIVRQIMTLWYLKAIGAFYLAYLAIDHFVRKRGFHHRSEPGKKPGFWRTVIAVELTDIAFAIDGVLVAVALSNQLWVIYTGAVLGILAVRLAAGFFIGVLEKHPRLENVAYLVVGWTSVKLFLKTYASFAQAVLDKTVSEDILPGWLFWTVLLLIISLGTLWAYRKQDPSEKIPN
ncbi:MAG TPA: TerC family protein [candidate division Zixibacteria bacterium]|nr:TerC family protein [candidate division Zixibacteria bacterium]